MIPEKIKIFHIIHIDRLPSLLKEGFLFSDFEVQKRKLSGTTIGMNKIKTRRLEELTLSAHPGLHVGQCVPFYFCPRSVMLYVIFMGNNSEIEYRGGQDEIIHLVADMNKTIAWANGNALRWAFTTSNAGSRCFEDFADLQMLDKIKWDVIRADKWTDNRESKQAEFLVEQCFSWKLIEKIGVSSRKQYIEVVKILDSIIDRPIVSVEPSWYY